MRKGICPMRLNTGRSDCELMKKNRHLWITLQDVGESMGFLTKP
jgi:hypothetical protein